MRNVMVIDDSVLIREVARVGLETTGSYSVAAFESGREAVQQAVSEPPDLFLLDVEMPDMDGPATLAELRARPETRDVPVVFVTGKDTPEDRRRLEELGAAGVITKPFDATALPREVAGLMGWET